MSNKFNEDRTKIIVFAAILLEIIKENDPEDVSKISEAISEFPLDIAMKYSMRSQTMIKKLMGN